MDEYTKLLDEVSNSILNFDKEDSIKDLVTPETYHNFPVYKRNYFFNVLEHITEEFPSVLAYIGFDNLKFFARKYLLDSKITTINIQNFCFDFCDFLESSTSIHQDDIINQLARIDVLYQNGTFKGEQHFEASQGVLLLWSQLTSDTSIDSNQKINLDCKEQIFVFEVNGERFLKAIAMKVSKGPEYSHTI